MSELDQRRINWDETCLRRHLESCRLPRVEIELICLLNRSGQRMEREGAHHLDLTVSRREAAKGMGCCPTAVVKAAQRLVERGLLAVFLFGPKPTYVLSLDRLAKLEPPPSDPLGGVDPFAGEWSSRGHPPATGGHPPDTDWPPGGHPVDTAGHPVATASRARVSVKDQEIKSRALNRASRAFRGAQGGAGGNDDARCPPGGQSVSTGGRPESAASLARLPTVRLRDVVDDDVRRMDLPRLVAAYRDCVDQGWLEAGHEDLRKFLAACHHAARSDGVRLPSRLVYCAVRDYHFERVNQSSWDWAEKTTRDLMLRIPQLGGDVTASARGEIPRAVLKTAT